MLNHSLKALSITAALALAATAASAQTPPAPPQPVTRIGVTPQDSHEAVQKAAPNATATLVRTEPAAAAAEKARTKTPDDKSSAKPPKATPPKTELDQRANTAPNPSSATNDKTTGTVTNTTTPSAAMGITGTFPGAKPTSGEGPAEPDGTTSRKDGATQRQPDALEKKSK